VCLTSGASVSLVPKILQASCLRLSFYRVKSGLDVIRFQVRNLKEFAWTGWGNKVY